MLALVQQMRGDVEGERTKHLAHQMALLYVSQMTEETSLRIFMFLDTQARRPDLSFLSKRWRT